MSEAIVFNPQRFVWNPAEKMEDVIRFGLRSMNDYVGDLRRGGILRKLVRSRRRLVPAIAFLVKKATRNAMARVPLGLRSSFLRGSMAARVTHLFDQFAARETRISMTFTQGDPSLNELGAYFGAEGRNLHHANVSVETLKGLDHNFTSSTATAMMLDRTLAALACEAPRHARRAPGRTVTEPRREVCAT